MEKANADIRTKAADTSVYLWQIANALGIRDNEFSRRLRFELPEHEKARIFEVIDGIATGRGGGRNEANTNNS